MSNWNQKLNEVDYFLQKCLEMDKFLGGNQLQQEEGKKKKGNEVESLQEIIRENLFGLQQKQQERDTKLEKHGRSDPDVIRANIMIKDSIKTTRHLLEELFSKTQLVAKKKKVSAEQILHYNTVHSTLKKQINKIQAIEEGDIDYIEQEDKRATLVDFKSESNEMTMLREKNMTKNNERVDPNEIELEAMEGFKRQDKLMEEKGEIIARKAEEWKQQAIGLGQKQEQVVHMIKQVDKQVDKTSQALLTQNQKLKAIVHKYRTPSKFCLDIVLLLVVIGLIGLIIKML